MLFGTVMKKTALAMVLIYTLLFSSAELVEMAHADPFYSVYAPVEQVPSTIPPSVSIYSPQNNTYYFSNDVTVSLRVKNVELAGWNSSITKVAYFLDGKGDCPLHTTYSYYDEKGKIPEFATEFNLSSLSSGKHNFTAIANVLVLRDDPHQYFVLHCSSTIFFTIFDVTAPVISSLSVVNKTYSQNDLPLNFTVDESTSWMGYSLDGQLNVTVTGNFTLTKLASGSHALTVYANDTSGNMGVSETLFFNIEPFPTTIVVASVITVVFVGIGLLVYFKKRKH